ncbi:avidin/streptavidin family protein [Photorhabdus kleinii]|uniref:avidin/streptavidin family protein n=1 Tax=Photorhabdus kleinii TaxID=768034 RepID=UPI0021D4F316|nr:avidin/streptavidin family protein [Photorhabdus kleinii]MCT8343901.1 avidin/streptavidin family protein [Photorhabdus kleinii]
MLLEEILGLVDTDIGASDSDIDIAGYWRNELGSTIHIKKKIKETNSFGGTYSSTVGTDHHSHDGIITGHLHGDLIVFVVRWDSAAVSAWVGQVQKNKNNERHKITTLWMMASKSNGWTPINVGADTFFYIPPQPQPDNLK